ncbi:hypothetical protein D3C80_1064880 [compost metagenome]
MQGEVLAGLAVGDGRRVLQADEVLHAGARLADVGADVIARKQGVDARHATGADARADYPELRVLAGEALGLLVELDGGVDVFLVVTQGHFGDVTDHHVTVAYLGLVGRQPRAGLEGEGDGRAFLHQVVHDQGKPDQHGHDGHDPHQGKAEAPSLDRCRAGNGRAVIAGWGHP